MSIDEQSLLVKTVSVSTKFSKPQRVVAKVINTIYLNEKVKEVTFEVMSISTFDFKAGQFINLSCGNGFYRAYSIASTSSSTSQIGVIAAVGHDGVGANYIRGLKTGDIVNFIGPSGRFVLPETIQDTIVFVATGTGLAPILPMVDYLSSINATTKVHLYFGVRDKSELFKIDQLNAFKSSMKNFNYTFCFSKEVPADLADVSMKGRVTTAIVLDKYNLESTQYFICGNPYMVIDMNTALKNSGVSDDNIFYEKFTVTKHIAN